VLSFIQYSTIPGFLGFFVLGWAGMSMGTYAAGMGFFAAFTTPIRVLYDRLRTASAIATALIAYFTRRRAWSFLKSIAMGLDGYSGEIPDIHRKPFNGINAYEELSDEIVMRVQDKQNVSLIRQASIASRLLSQSILSPSDVEKPLKTIERDVSLVHAVYYNDPECIGRIGDWISGLDAQLKFDF
jgi:hypothetical protein